MSFRSGDDAIERLAELATHEDASASSHWRKYHQHFAFDGTRFTGIEGFGGSRRRAAHRTLLHRLLQIPYRRMGRDFEAFGRIDRLAEAVTRKQEREYDLDVLRQTLTLAYLLDHIGDRLDGTKRAIVIGDGFASMTSLLLQSGAAKQVVLVNLSKTLLVDLWYLRLLLGPDFNARVAFVEREAELEAAMQSEQVGVIAAQATDHTLIRSCTAAVAINIASMQEMNRGTVEDYFEDLRSISRTSAERLAFYCCNRVSKELPDGEVIEFSKYPWASTDTIVDDDLCPWHQKYYSAKPPFYVPYDGPIQHRLAILN